MADKKPSLMERNVNLKAAFNATNHENRMSYCAIAQVIETGRLADETSRLAEAQELLTLLEYVKVVKDLNEAGVVDDARLKEISDTLSEKFGRIL